MVDFEKLIIVRIVEDLFRDARGIETIIGRGFLRCKIDFFVLF